MADCCRAAKELRVTLAVLHSTGLRHDDEAVRSWTREWGEHFRRLTPTEDSARERVLCAHADRDGEGAHWRYVDEPCSMNIAREAGQ